MEVVVLALFNNSILLMSNWEINGKQKFLISPQTIPLLLCALNKKWTISLLFAQYSEIVHLFVCIRSHHGIEKNIKNTVKKKKSTIKLPIVLCEFKPHQIFIISFVVLSRFKCYPLLYLVCKALHIFTFCSLTWKASTALPNCFFHLFLLRVS